MKNNASYTNSEYEKITHANINNLNINISFLRYVKVHLHGEFELVQILTGSVTVTTPTEEFTLQTGDVAFFSRYLPHSLISPDSDCCALVIQIRPDFCSSYFPQINNLVVDKSNITEIISKPADHHDFMEEIKHISFDLAYNYFAQKPGFQFRCISDINRIFGYIISCVPHKFVKESDIYETVRKEKRISRMLNYIDEHFNEKLSLNEIAERENVSLPYLSAFFKDQLHITFQNYVKMLRLDRAAFLLLNTDLKIYDICVDSGFSDPKYLNAAFKEVFNQTPLNFRKNKSTHLDSKQKKNARKESSNIQLIVKFEDSIDLLRKYHKYLCDDDRLVSALYD